MSRRERMQERLRHCQEQLASLRREDYPSERAYAAAVSCYRAKVRQITRWLREHPEGREE